MLGILGPKLDLINKPSCVCIGVGSSVVSQICNLGHIWGLIQDPRDLQDPIWRVSCIVSGLNFFHLLCAYFLRALNCTFTCRNSNLYWVGIGLGGCAGGPLTGGLEETSLAPTGRTGSSSERRMGFSSVRRTGVLICKEGRLPALRVTFCFVSAAALERLSVLLCPC